MLVTESLIEENYVSESRLMVIGLSIKNNAFIDGTFSCMSDDLPSWIKNNIVISRILNLVSKPISASIFFVDSARSIWLNLKECFQQKNTQRIFQLKRSVYLWKLPMWRKSTNCWVSSSRIPRVFYRGTRWIFCSSLC